MSHDPAATPLPTTAASSKPKPPTCILPTPSAAPPVAQPAKKCPPDPEGGPPFAPVVTLVFAGDVRVQAEVARSSAETSRGLMYRTQMPEDHGMLFYMPERDEHTFWMHNTCISLDMLFVDDDLTIVGILENVPTVNDDPRTVGCPSRYVIELNAGYCRKHGIVAGQKVDLPK